MSERYFSRKVHNIVTGIGSVLIIIGAVMQLLHIKMGISGKSLYVTVFALMFIYQSFVISKLYKKLKEKSQ